MVWPAGRIRAAGCTLPRDDHPDRPAFRGRLARLHLQQDLLSRPFRLPASVEGAGRTRAAATAVTGCAPRTALAGLADAIRDPGHPIARTVATREPTFDVTPTRPGGPALRTHVPLVVTRDGSEPVLGVLAVAHDLPIDPALRPLLQAGTDLAAVAIERYR